MRLLSVINYTIACHPYLLCAFFTGFPRHGSLHLPPASLIVFPTSLLIFFHFLPSIYVRVLVTSIIVHTPRTPERVFSTQATGLSPELHVRVLEASSTPHLNTTPLAFEFQTVIPPTLSLVVPLVAILSAHDKSDPLSARALNWSQP